MIKTKFIIPVVLITLSVCFLLVLNISSVKQQDITKKEFSEYKTEKRGGDLSKKPTEWFTLSRAYPFDEIPADAFKRAVSKASELRNNNIADRIGIWELAGPTNVGGRVTDVAVHPDYPNIIYIGAALGGVFKSIDAGISWTAISDDVPSLSVGDIEVDPFDQNVLYFGTGESNSSGDSYGGSGIYKTSDGGSSWDYLGLPESYHIGRIVIDPINNQRIYVAVMGKLFGTNVERGVYRSTDGGANWSQVLFVNDSTGCADIVINPNNPNILYASMWQRFRSPSDRRVGGINSGIWRSVNGGDTWENLSNGLPAPSSTNGRIGLAISPVNPDIIYASYVDHPGYLMGFWVSVDGGVSWTSRLVSPNPDEFSGFGWYFGRIWSHPTQPNTVYFGDVQLWKSTDQGAHWYSILDDIHVDQHGLYIDPNNPNNIICGNDGGVFMSQNGGSSWTKSYNLPITQFYAITIDQLTPQRIYGGTQDNSTPRTLDGLPDNWDVIFYGDGFYCNVDFTNSNIIYVEAQYGYLGKSTNLGQSWDLIRSGIDIGERTNWNTPVVMSPHNNNVLFYGTERVYKTVNGGNFWNPISTDLTGGNQPGSLVYGTITTIAQSSVSEDVIWAGTDDSRVWVTTNGGANWNLVSASLPNRWCTRVAPDPLDQMTAYVTFSGYKAEDDLSHIFKTTDYGISWTDISSNLVDIPVNDIIPDPMRPGYLYLATDFGMFYSSNDGAEWQTLGDNHPLCPVFDIDIHVGEQKLVSGTHGRSMYSYDLTQLEQSGCDYIPGNVNDDSVVNGLDLVYLVAYFKGAPQPPFICECGQYGQIFAAADPNGNCSINGLDVTYMLNYFKGGPGILYCPDCPLIG